MGFGLGNWPRAYPRYAVFDDGNYVNQAHNDWAQWAVEGGVEYPLRQRPGLGAWFFVLLGVLAASRTKT